MRSLINWFKRLFNEPDYFYEANQRFIKHTEVEGYAKKLSKLLSALGVASADAMKDRYFIHVLMLNLDKKYHLERLKKHEQETESHKTNKRP